jgi:antitoxin CcdA
MARMKRAHAKRRHRAASLPPDEKLVAEARQLELNASRIVEDRLRKVVTDERARRWLEENRAGFEAFERFVEKNGIFGEDERAW